MLRSADKIIGMAIDARDGRIGTVSDLYFDDQDWAVRYLVVEAGNWYSGTSVLLSPHSVRNPDWLHASLPVELTRDQVQNAPRSDSDLPVSRQFERKYYDYYGYPYYWEGPYTWGGTAYPFYPPTFPAQVGVTLPGEQEAIRTAPGKDSEREGDPHLRSVRYMKGYHVHARDGGIGHIEDFFLSEEDWTIRHLGVDTINWLPSKNVAVPSEWAKDIRWEEQAIYMDHLREEIRNAPSYVQGSPMTQELSDEIEHYFQSTGRRGR